VLAFRTSVSSERRATVSRQRFRQETGVAKKGEEMPRFAIIVAVDLHLGYVGIRGRKMRLPACVSNAHPLRFWSTCINVHT